MEIVKKKRVLKRNTESEKILAAAARDAEVKALEEAPVKPEEPKAEASKPLKRVHHVSIG